MNTKRMAMTSLSILSLILIAGCDKVSSTSSGSENRSLTIVSPANQSVTQGEANKVTLAIIRKNFDEDVKVTISDLPDGVSVAGGNELTIHSGSVKLDSITLVAAKDATPVEDHRVKVTAKGPGGISVTEYFKTTVTAKN